MDDALGEMYVAFPKRHLWRRITHQEGWEDGFFRAVELHERTGQPVRVSLLIEGNMVPKLQIMTRKGCLCIHCLMS
jgi:hypothetical protein